MKKYVAEKQLHTIITANNLIMFYLNFYWDVTRQQIFFIISDSPDCCWEFFNFQLDFFSVINWQIF